MSSNNNTSVLTTGENNVKETKKGRKFVKRSLAEVTKDYGKLSLERIVKNAVPSQDTLSELEKARNELEMLQGAIESIPETMRESCLRSAEFKVNALVEKMGSPLNLSENDRLILKNAARLILKNGNYNVLSLAMFVGDNTNIFPAVGAKF